MEIRTLAVLQRLKLLELELIQLGEKNSNFTSSNCTFCTVELQTLMLKLDENEGVLRKGEEIDQRAFGP